MVDNIIWIIMRMALCNRIDRMTGYPVEHPQVDIVQNTVYGNYLFEFLNSTGPNPDYPEIR